MKRLTYVTVIVGNQPRRSNARKIAEPEFDCQGFEAVVQGVPHGFLFIEEGITWARGWHTPAAKALRVAQALT